MNKLLLHPLQLLLVVLASWTNRSGFAQHNDLKEFGYKGPVESATTYMYFPLTGELTADSANLYCKTFRHLDEDGNVNYYSNEYFFKGNLDIVTSVTSHVSFFIDSTGVKTDGKGKTTQFSGDSVLQIVNVIYTFTWNGEYTYSKRSYDASLGTLTGEEITIMDETFFATTVTHNSYENDNVVFTSQTTYTKNAQGQISESVEDADNYENPVIQTYEYKAFDSYGNPTEIIIYTRDGDYTSSMLLVKVYDYYTADER